MRVRAISATEIEEFSGIGAGCKENLLRLWQDGTSRPEWCFLIEDDDYLGRIVYWVFPASPEEIKVMGLELPWDHSDFIEIGLKLIEESLSIMRTYGAKNLECRVYSDQGEDVSGRLRLFKSLGIPMIQEKHGMLLRREENRELHDRLEYISLAETSEDMFISGLELVTKGTLDREDRLSISHYGINEAARRMFNNLKDIDYDPDKWLLGYHNDQLVGLVVPQIFSDEEGAINYIGILPEQRGKEYVVDLLAKGVGVLFAEGVKRVLADVDVENVPMVAALEKIGFQRDYGLWVYQKNL